MTGQLETEHSAANNQRLAADFTRLGWLGFFAQLILLIIPVVLVVYVLLLRNDTSPQTVGIDLSNYLSYGSLIVLVFTTFWFYRYTKLATKFGQPGAAADAAGAVWIGIWASCLGIVFSLLVLASAVGRMLFTLLITPQTGLMVAPPAGGSPAGSISAADAVSLASVVFMLAAELIVLGLSLWLLYRTWKASGEINTSDLVISGQS